MESKHILLKTTINDVIDDWHIGRFSLLKAHLENCGHRVSAYDRRTNPSNDIDLADLASSDVDQLWLFAVDVVDAITEADAIAIQTFRERGGGLLLTRDHQDLGTSLLKLGLVGHAHHFHACNPEPDPSRHAIDDTVNPDISWPNYHSGANGDYQVVALPNPNHPLVQRADGTPLQFLPTHPHEGVVSVPDAAHGFAKEINRGKSLVTGNEFCCAVAFSEQLSDEGQPLGRTIAQSAFHHFVDPNLDASMPLPSFVSEPSGSGMKDNPQALTDTLRYIENLASWL